MLFGFIGVYLSVKTIREQYIEIQLESNRRTAETIAKLFGEKLETGISEADLIRSFQTAIEGSHSDAGYLCMFDNNEGILLCHPDSNVIGKSINSDKLQFKNMDGARNELLIDAVSTNKAEYGILNFTQTQHSEIVYMVPVHGTSWKISVHENIEKTDKLFKQFQLATFGGFVLLSLLISLFATLIVRRLSRKYESKIEEKNKIISKHADNLEIEVTHRTAKLKSINNKLVDLEKAKSDFLAIISHELRTPLNGILGFSTILEGELKSVEHLEYINIIRNSGERLLKFSDTALLVTQLNVQQNLIDYNLININEMLEELKNEFGEIIKEKSLKIIFEKDKDCKPIAGVPKMIKRCVSNILENSLSYSPVQGEIKFHCYNDANQIHIDITDKGHGFSEEAFLRQFDLFGADEVNHRSEGFGLGLVAARLIMHAHSGDIQIRNQEDGGALVCLQFPFPNDEIIKK